MSDRLYATCKQRSVTLAKITGKVVDIEINNRWAVVAHQANESPSKLQVTVVSLVNFEVDTYDITDSQEKLALKMASNVLSVVYTKAGKLLWTSIHMSNKAVVFTEDLQVKGVIAFAPAH